MFKSLLCVLTPVPVALIDTQVIKRLLLTAQVISLVLGKKCVPS
jgi:hypothetical protein